VGCTGSATIATIVEHIEHIKRIAGVQSVGFGADFDGIGVVPADASSVASYPAVIKVPIPITQDGITLPYAGASSARLEQC
jgi:microsomal dipeptidase-like Zn-dependent dipeptidase